MVSYAVTVVVNQDVLWWASGCESLWIKVCFAQPVNVNHCAILRRVWANHGVLFLASGWESRCECCASGCESWWVMMSQWLWITICYYVPVVVNHGVLFCANMWQPWWGMLSQWLTIILYYTEPVVVNHIELCWDSGFESWCAMISKCVGIMVC